MVFSGDGLMRMPRSALRVRKRATISMAMPTSTGAVADHRLPLKPSEVEAFARELAAKLGVDVKSNRSDLPELAHKWVDELAKDLREDASDKDSNGKPKPRAGRVLVIAGEHTSPATQLLALAMNRALDAFGIELIGEGAASDWNGSPTP